MVSLRGVERVRRVCEGCGQEYSVRDERQRRCRNGCSRYKGAAAVRFVAIDGEGLGANPSCYVLLGVGDKQIENINGLTWQECFRFLYERFEREGRGVAYVGFFLGYDFTQILKTLPEDTAWMLLTSEGRALRAHRVKGKEPHPVQLDGWQFDILGMKRLRIRPKRCMCRNATCACKGKAPWMYVCDAGGFWQTSFLNVINPKGWMDPIVSFEEYEKVRDGKEKRGIAELDDEMREYNLLENELFQRAMSELCKGFESLGIHLTPKQWFGPGQAASNWMRGKLPGRETWLEGIPGWYLGAARESYFGGWFEVMCHGYLKGKTHEYDVNSAYPSIIAKLPCLLHGEYTRGTGIPRNVSRDDLCLVKGRFRIPGFNKNVGGQSKSGRQTIGSMLHRNTDGSICRPSITEGTFWWSEIQSAQRAGLIGRIAEADVREWYIYRPCECEPPLKGMEELYDERLRVGKESPLGKGAKVAYNSAYGKFAQSVGNPRFGNPVYASRITSGCREMICDAIATHPEGQRAVAMVATDAVFFLTEHPGLEISNKLGEWGHVERENLTIFKPGVYWDDETREQVRNGDKPKFKARGINAQAFAEELWRIDYGFQQWGSGGVNEWPDVVFQTDFSLISALQALRRRKWWLAGTNDPKQLTHSSNPFRKRTGLWLDGVYQVWRSDIRGAEWSYDRGDWDCVSTAYKKNFGLDDPFSDESKELYGVTEDGIMGDSFKALLNNKE